MRKKLYSRKSCWNALDGKYPAPGIVVSVIPEQERIDRNRDEAFELINDDLNVRPKSWTPEWKEVLIKEISMILAQRQLPGIGAEAINAPASVYGESQGICDLFDVTVEKLPDSHFYVHPLPADPDLVNKVEPKKLKESMYWKAVEWIGYARTVMKERFSFHNPTMTGPFDTANYLLGTTCLLEWVYTEPETIHRLLKKITTVIIEMLKELKRIADGPMHGFRCVNNAFRLCSECRALVSAEMFEKFEAPYLKKIGDEVGPYGIHSCGSWERTVPVSIRDSNLKVMDGQVKENDLEKLCSLANGKVVFSIGPSFCLDKKYLWDDTKSFLEYVLKTVPSKHSVGIAIKESDIDLFNELYCKLR